MIQALPRVSVILLCYNHWDLTKQCLESLAKTTPPIVEIIVVDNGSSDKTVEALESSGRFLFGDVFRRIRLEENRNIATAINIGGRVARGDFLFLLNNDTIAQPNWLPPLLQAFDNNANLAAVGPLLMYPDKTVQHLGVAFEPENKVQVRHLYQYLPISHQLVSRKRYFQALTGAAMFLPRELFLIEGLWDEEFSNGLEDIDFCLRLARKNYRFFCIPESTFFHLESKTIGAQSPHLRRNASRFWRKWDQYNFIDLPDLVIADGYELRIMPDLLVKISTPPEQSKEYLSHLHPFSAALCFSFLEEEPYWLDGYDLLGKYLEQRGEWKVARQIYLDSVKYTQTFSCIDYMRIARTTKALGEDASKLDAIFNNLSDSIQNESSYEEKRQWLIKKFSEGTPAQHSLLPQYDQAVREAKKLRLEWAKK